MKKEERQRIKTIAKQLVASVSAEEEASQKGKLEDLFSDYETTLAEVRASEQAATEDNLKLSEQIETLKAEKQELEDQLKEKDVEMETLKASIETDKADLEAAVAEANKKVEVLQAKFDELEKAAMLQTRVKDLEEAGILAKGKAADKQLARITKMDEGEFKEYVAEFLSIREEWERTVAEAAPSNAELDEEDNEEEDFEADLEDTNLSVAQLIKLKRASAAIASNRRGSNDTVVYDENGVNVKLRERYEEMWSVKE